RGRYYKLKVGGDIGADLDRLTRIASVLDRTAGDYRTTLDGNEQYDDVEGIGELWRRMRETPALARLVASTLFIEQPIKRAAALIRPVDALARLKPLIIDESDGAPAHPRGHPRARLPRLPRLRRGRRDGFRRDAQDAGRAEGAHHARPPRAAFMSASPLPERFATVAQLEDCLSEPTAEVAADLA